MTLIFRLIIWRDIWIFHSKVFSSECFSICMPHIYQTSCLELKIRKKVFCPLKKHFRLIYTAYFSICMPNIYQTWLDLKKRKFWDCSTLSVTYLCLKHIIREKSTFFVLKASILPSHQFFFLRLKTVKKEAWKKDFAQFLHKVSEVLLTHGFSSRGLRDFFYEWSYWNKSCRE